MVKRARCPSCTRPLALCYCSLLPSLHNHWPVQIMQYSAEAKHALGTARIAALGLTNAWLTPYTPITSKPEEAGSLPCALIYPSDSSDDLQVLAEEPAHHLIVLDGTWKKSKRMLLESPYLADIPHYRLPAVESSRYRIRKEPTPQSVSTLEAIVTALGVLEDRQEYYHPLLKVMDALIEQQTSRMPKDVLRDNYPSNKDC
ncbi:MAG: tRNA-uridine aminocarboxypropyltransferase [Pseudohongiellaceae bacterium]|nr:tRNA-uridine aminocarboxypropyltransferase [Pseudohongiellaceae bacterium]